MTVQDVISYVLDRAKYFEVMLRTSMSDMPKELIPDLKFNPKSEEVFIVPGKIEIGLKRIFSRTKEDVLDEVTYYLGHEEQHQRSTTDKAWTYGQKRGMEIIMETASKNLEKFPRRFRTDADYERFVDTFLKDQGYILDFKVLLEIVHFICNALEDGRIERIRSIRNKQFMRLLKKFRGLLWKKEECQVIDVQNATVQKKLTIILNQILSLSTTSLYQKGFTKYYYGTDIEKTVQKVMPHIAKGVAARDCRSCMNEAVEICQILAMDILEACKKQEIDPALIEMIKDMLLNPSKYSATEQDEDTCDEIGDSLFGKTDIDIELEDDEYDELMERLKNEEQKDEKGDLRVHIKRKNEKEEKKKPKESENQDSEENSGGDGETSNEESEEEGSGAGKDNEEDSVNSTNGSEGTEDNAPTEEGDESPVPQSKQGSSEEEVESESSGSGGTEKQEEDDQSENGSAENSSETSNQDDAEEDISQAGSGQENEEENEAAQEDEVKSECGGESEEDDNESSNSKYGEEDNLDDLVEKAMEESEENSREEIETSQSRANKIASDYNKKKEEDSVLDESGLPESVQDIKGDYSYHVKFQETKRTYQIDKDMDIELQMQCDVVSNECDNIFNNQIEPNITCKKSGSINEDDLYKLAISELDFYMKQGDTNEFDGCAELLLDNSGSMGEGKFSSRYYASRALAILEEGFKKKMPVKIVAFDAYNKCGETVNHLVIKNWEERHPFSCSYNYYENGPTGMGNKDGYSIRVATKELLARPESKKILGILSDGLPSYYNSDKEGFEDVREAVNEARRQGIEVFSIYFTNEMSRDFAANDKTSQTFLKMYGGNAICSRTEDLPEALINMFQSFILD